MYYQLMESYLAEFLSLSYLVFYLLINFLINLFFLLSHSQHYAERIAFPLDETMRNYWILLSVK